MDKLKHYLRENRVALDVEMPPADLWQPIQVQLVAQAAKAMLIKYIIGIGIAAVIGTGAWWTIHKQKTTHTPAIAPVPAAPPKEFILKDTVPDTPAQSAPVVKPKKKKVRKTPPPAPPVIHKHKKRPDTTVHPIKPRPKRKAIRPAV